MVGRLVVEVDQPNAGKDMAFPDRNLDFAQTTFAQGCRALTPTRRVAKLQKIS